MTAQTFTSTSDPRRRRMVALAASAVALPLAGLAALAAPAGAAGTNPKGNNGTIKVDRAPFDNAPNNEPHVGCKFEIDFYGFDQGADKYAQVTFNANPPTGRGEQLLTDKVFIGEDDNSGGGSEAGLDAHKEYDLSTALAKFTPQPQQGYHVKLTIHADGSQGADVKHKVFWVDGCTPVSNPPTPETPNTPETPKTPDTPQTPKQPNTPQTPKQPDVEVKPYGKDALPPATPTSKPAPQTEVKGTSLTRPDAELPHTGAETLPLAGLGLALLGAGQAARMAVRRVVH